MRRFAALALLVPTLAVADVWKITNVTVVDGTAELKVAVRVLETDPDPYMRVTLRVPQDATNAEVDARVVQAIKAKQARDARPKDPLRLNNRKGTFTP